MRLTLLPLLLLVPPIATASGQCAPEVQQRLVAHQLNVTQAALEAQLARVALERDDPDHVEAGKAIAGGR